MPWLYGKPMNDRPFRYLCEGFEFFSERCDFKGIVYVVKPTFGSVPEYALMKATSSMVGYHACNIHKELNGFSGYDCITFEFVDESVSLELKADFGLGD